MKNKIILLLIITSSLLYSQDVGKVETALKAFKYEEVISISRQLLGGGELMPKRKLIEVYRMKATAHYVLGEIDSAIFCFAEILSVDEKYELNPIDNSPKIITLFNQTQTEYLKNNALRQIQTQPIKKVNQSVINESPQKQFFKGAMVRSIILPGWGHYHIEQKKKGLALGISSIVAMTSSLYFIYETNRLERDYLNELDVSRVDKRYADYNEAYKLRNISLSVYAVLWLYAQIDLSNQTFFEIDLGEDTEVHSYIGPCGSYLFSIQYKF